MKYKNIAKNEEEKTIKQIAQKYNKKEITIKILFITNKMESFYETKKLIEKFLKLMQ